MKLDRIRVNAVLIMIGLIVCVIHVPSAGARLFGEFATGYSLYNAEGALPADREKDESFYHRYLLGYQNAGWVARKRLGKYDYMLGYEWGALTRRQVEGNSATEESGTTRKGHIVYSGNLSIKLPGYPVSLNAYSYDTTRLMQFDSSAPDTPTDGIGHILSRRPFYFSGGGTSINSGVIIDVGQSKLLQGTNMFNQLPRLILEYQDKYVSDFKSDFIQHGRTTTYIGSLGKGQVWLRYQLTSEKDYLSPAFSSDMQQLNIGTVDHKLRRSWIDVTNWIRISADGQLTRTKKQETSEEQYDLNLFAALVREKWELKNYNYFTNLIEKTDGQIRSTRTVSLPFYIDGVWGADTNWSARFVTSDTKSTDSDNARRNLLTSVRLETFKRENFTLTPSLSFQKDSTPLIDKMMADARVESSSTRRFSDRLAMNGSYAFRLTTEDNQGGSNSKSTDQELRGKVAYSVTERVKVSYDQTFSWKTGQDASISGANALSNLDLQNKIVDRSNESSRDSKQSISTFAVAWAPTARMNLGSSATADVKKSKDTPLDTIISISNSINYVLPEYKLNGKVRYATRQYDSTSASEWDVETGLINNPNRNMESSVKANYYHRIDEANSTRTTATIRQRFAYTLSDMFNRRVLQLAEESMYQKNDSPETVSGLTYKTRRALSLMANYYPTKNIFLGAAARYSLLDPGSVNEIYYSVSAGFTYNKLQATIDYAYGQRNGTDKRLESRFSANLKKQF